MDLLLLVHQLHQQGLADQLGQWRQLHLLGLVRPLGQWRPLHLLDLVGPLGPDHASCTCWACDHQLQAWRTLCACWACSALHLLDLVSPLDLIALCTLRASRAAESTNVDRA